MRCAMLCSLILFSSCCPAHCQEPEVNDTHSILEAPAPQLKPQKMTRKHLKARVEYLEQLVKDQSDEIGRLSDHLTAKDHAPADRAGVSWSVPVYQSRPYGFQIPRGYALQRVEVVGGGYRYEAVPASAFSSGLWRLER